jgi:DNA-directed RNA polymerase subunit H (RpoH/RPB5)
MSGNDATTSTSACRPLQCDDIDDHSAPDMTLQGPAKALEAAQNQEHARVTLGRAMKSLLHMLDVRGYTVTNVGGHKTHEGGMDAATAAKDLESSERALMAEVEHEIIVEAEIMQHAKFSTAWARGLPIGSKVFVVIITKGNVTVMREVMHSMEDSGSKHVILVSRFPLTPYSKKWIAECKGMTIEFFLLESLQGIIDQHKLVPRHIPLDTAHAERVKLRYKAARFPKLLTSDPMVQYLGLLPGMIIMASECMGREQAAISFFEVSEM